MSLTTMPSVTLKLFYKDNKPSLLRTSDSHHTVVSVNNQNLCETNSQTAQTRLLATDAQDSSLAIGSIDQIPITYSPFGNDNCTVGNSLLSRFTGQLYLASATGYLLGNGHRLFNPRLMRFHSPDGLSPFDRGGVNSYCYCANDPINRVDPSGKSFRSIIKWRNGGYSYKTLAPRLDRRNPNLSINEYGALKKSIAKREKQAIKELNSALSSGLQSEIHNNVTKSDILKGKRTTLESLTLDDNKRYNPDITKELLGNIPAWTGKISKIADDILAAPTPESAVNVVSEELLMEDMEARLWHLRH